MLRRALCLARTSVRPLLLAASIGSATFATAAGQDDPLALAERFALAADRESVLAELTPGTPDAYYYACLHHQNQGRAEEAKPLLEAWIQRHGRSERTEHIALRQLLLRSEVDPAGTYLALRDRLGLRLDAERPRSKDEVELPTVLDPAQTSFEAFARDALAARPESAAAFRPEALPELLARKPRGALLTQALERLDRPDLPGLPEAVIEDLRRRGISRWGDQQIHSLLLLDQREECARLEPRLLSDPEFVSGWLLRLAPGADVLPEAHPDVHRAHLERVLGFARRLPGSMSSLLAHALYHRLADDLRRGIRDRAALMEYLRLPRRASWARPEYRPDPSRGLEAVDLDRDYPTGFGPVRSDEALVRALLSQVFLHQDSFEEFRETIRTEWLEQRFAETKLLAGQGDPERWIPMLGDLSRYEALKRRVEIEFAPTQARSFAAEEAVRLEVDVKNVETLLIKVFEIDALNYYREKGREVDASVELDGLVPTLERVLPLDQPPLRRVRHGIELPELARPGVFVIDLIGSGLASRAVLHKGSLRHVERVSAAGQIFRVLDEQGGVLPDASLWVGPLQYHADEQGDILVPFSTDPKTRDLILQHGELAQRARFRHLPERYEFSAGVVLDREQLVPGRESPLVVRPQLSLNGRPVSLTLLEGVSLHLRTRDVDGLELRRRIPDLQLRDDADLVHLFEVPTDLVELEVHLEAEVPLLTTGQPLALRTLPFGLELQRILRTDETSAGMLGRNAEGHFLDLRGRNGEPIAGQPLLLQLEHRAFDFSRSVSLETDAEGRVRLGSLEEVRRLRLVGENGQGEWWELAPERRLAVQDLAAVEGEDVVLAYPADPDSFGPRAVSLLERRGGAEVRDCFSFLQLSGEQLRLRGLPAGDYALRFHETGQSAMLRVSKGRRQDEWVIGPDRALWTPPRQALALVEVETAGDEVVLRFEGTDPSTRVHAFAQRYFPATEILAAAQFGGPDTREGTEASFLGPDCSYHSGRSIGGEYRYILERRYAAKFPGNMLQRPGLVLNPWVREDSSSSLNDVIGAGGGFGGKSGGGRAGYGGRAGGRSAPPSPASTFVDLRFLDGVGELLANQRPDEAGRVRLPRAALGDGGQLHVVAIQGALTGHWSRLLPERPVERRDQRLLTALDPARHATEQRELRVMVAEDEVVVRDLENSEIAVYESLGDLFRLLTATDSRGELQDFEFLLHWPELDEVEKRARYSGFACHELHFFLYEKDRDFFDRVVAPFIAQKLQRTFLDDWLLGADLAAYLEPWSFARLNAFERILLARRSPDHRTAILAALEDRAQLAPPTPLDRRTAFERSLRAKGVAARPGRDGADKAGEAAAFERPPEADAAAGQWDEKRKEAKAQGEMIVEEQELEEEAREPMDSPMDARDLLRREAVVALARAPERTRASVERHYWQLPLEQHTAEHIVVDEFWLDYARQDEGAPFLSEHVALATDSLSERLLALAVLDLPFEAAGHALEVEPGRARLRAGGPAILVLQQVRETADEVPDSSILVAQSFFRLDDRFRFEGSVRREKPVQGSFVRGVAYACQVVLTNPSATPHSLDLLLQVPEGSIPLAGGLRTRGETLELEAWSTRVREYHFYFPEEGEFSHYPVHVSEGDRLVAFVPPRSMAVLAEDDDVDTDSWAHLCRAGTLQQVHEALDRWNLQRVDFGLLAWRMRDPSAYEGILSRLRGRMVFDRGLWSYAFLHRDAVAARELLRQESSLIARCGPVLVSPLLEVDPFEQRLYEHMDFSPLINARAHPYGGERRIQDPLVRQQYAALIDILAHRRTFTDLDRLRLTHALMLQDRIEEALATFARIPRDRVATRIQYDAVAAYLAFFSDDPTPARAIATPYLDHPVDRWRTLFAGFVEQLDQIRGAPRGGGAGEGLATSDSGREAVEASLELEVVGGRVVVRHRNLERVELRYYRTDVEFSFSRDPFARPDSESFAFVRPDRRSALELEPGAVRTEVELPRDLAGSNLLVEVRGGGLSRRQSSLSTALSVQTLEQSGQLRVSRADTDEVLARVYVKVFARDARGTVRFHKDGYTDHRGRFDYVATSDEASPASRFAVLVLSEQDGAVVREMGPPLR